MKSAVWNKLEDYIAQPLQAQMDEWNSYVNFIHEKWNGFLKI